MILVIKIKVNDEMHAVCLTEELQNIFNQLSCETISNMPYDENDIEWDVEE